MLANQDAVNIFNCVYHVFAISKFLKLLNQFAFRFLSKQILTILYFVFIVAFITWNSDLKTFGRKQLNVCLNVLNWTTSIESIQISLIFYSKIKNLGKYHFRDLNIPRPPSPTLPFARRPTNPGSTTFQSNFANILLRSWKMGEKIGKKSIFHWDFCM